tara:strand:+ start:303 stop:464 length:162 start_codon:yes stop_codon:yes gene_type:complete
MKKITSIINSQRTAIVILLILNLLQLREIGLLRLKIDAISHKLEEIASVEHRM